MHRFAHSMVILIVAVGLASVSPPVSAAPGGAEAAKVHFQRGRQAFDSGQYTDAIEAWTQARDLLPPDPSQAKARNSLTFNLVVAHQKAFEQGLGPSHIKAAERELTAYEATIWIAHGDDAAAREADEQKAATKREELEALSAAASEPAAPSTTPATTPTPAPAPAPAPATESQPVAETTDPIPPPQRDDDKKPGKGLIATGSVLLVAGLGVVGGVMGAGMAVASKANDDLRTTEPGPDRQDALSAGQRGNTMTIVGPIVGGALAVTGIALLAAGGAKRKKSKARAMQGPTWRGVAIHPSWNGITVRMRF